MSQQAERRVGTIIGGKWRVDALLGAGSMAAVYAVTHRNGARAALKILHPTLGTDPAVCERFLGEGYLANSVKHQGIVRVLDDGVTDDGCVFLTMDLLEGLTLEDHRQKRGMKIPIVEALDLGDKLMDVLSAVHSAGIIHRDLKPQNVFVCDDGVLKLLDFGVARVFDRTSQSKLSMFGLVLGTPSFMSPEQALGSRDKVDHRSDIWSFGATLFTALTGETVHLGANVQAKLLAAATVKARSIAMVMPSLPAGIAAAIDMSLRFKKEDRWQSVDVMRRAFREARDNANLGRPVEAVRRFDMSLDESTHVDKGGASQPPPKLEGYKSRRPPSEAPPEGPGGTFIGIGDKNGKLTAAIGSDGFIPPPPAFITNPPPAPSTQPAHAVPHPSVRPRPSGPPRPASAAPPPLPRMPTPGVAVAPFSLGNSNGLPFLSNQLSTPQLPPATSTVRRLPTPDHDQAGIHPVPIRGNSRSDVQEGSVPAYGNTLNFGADSAGQRISEIDPRELGMRRKGSVAVWLMAVLLVAAALGGIAFFAVKKDPSSVGNGVGPDRDRGSPSPSATSPSTSVLPPTAVTAPMMTVGDPSPPPTVAVTKDAAAGTPTPPVTTPTPPARPAIWRPAPGHAPRAPTRPAAPPTNDPPPDSRATPPGLAPDPFGTPE